MVRHFLSFGDFSKSELEGMLKHADTLKQWQRKGKRHQPLAGKTLGLLFEKSSTRTRISFEAAMFQLGGHAIYLTQQTSQLGRGESYEDTARVLSRYVQGLVVRTFEHEKLCTLARHASIPVINGLTDYLHPCQILADLMTCIENGKSLKDMRVAWVGDGNNVANSWIEAARIFRFPLILACPKGYEPSLKGEGGIELTQDPARAVAGADVINTDTWVSMGQEGKGEVGKKKVFAPYQVNAELLQRAKTDCIVLHCLPAHRGEEITDEVIDGPRSRVWDQAENRLHVQKAVLKFVMSHD